MSVIVIDAKSIANCALPSTNAGIPATCPAIAPALPIAVPTTCPAPTARESAITSGAYFNASASALALPNILDNDVEFLNFPIFINSSALRDLYLSLYKLFSFLKLALYAAQFALLSLSAFSSSVKDFIEREAGMENVDVI